MGEQKNIPFCPKNVRQIGEIQNNYKIYIEDYVVTFLTQIRRRLDIGSKAFLILGEKQIAQKEDIFIINAVICSKKQRLEEGLPIFDKEELDELLLTQKKEFPMLSILGWGIIESPFNTISEETLFRDVGQEFQKEGKFFIKIEQEEDMQSLFLYKNNIAIPITGYRIFYDTNEEMQNYLLQWHSEHKNPPSEYVRDIAIKQFRSTIVEKKEEHNQNKLIGFLYTASTIMLIVMCAMGITMLNNYQKLQQVETAMNHLIETMEEKEEYPKEWENSLPVSAPQADSEDAIELSDKEKQAQTEEVEVEESEAAETANSNIPQQYIICKGDSLTKISMKFYKTPKMVNQICQINNITNPDTINEGEIILLP